MEKLINILPNLITNEDSSWLQTTIRNPNSLTRDIMKHYNAPLHRLAIIYGREILPSTVEAFTDKSTIDDLIAGTSASTQKDGAALGQLLTEIKGRFDCEGKSASAILWAAAIINSIEEKGVDDDYIRKCFLGVANTIPSKEKVIGQLHNELRGLIASDQELFAQADDYLVTAFVTNQTVQESENWYDFRTLLPFEMQPTMEISSKEDLFEALKDINNYNNIVAYLKENYLNETDPRKDGYCADDSEKNYKAYIIMSSLAHELYKDDPEFDADNNIGLNLTTGILAYQDEFNKKHLLNGLTNGLNTYEEAAGRIVDSLLGRKTVMIHGEPKFSVARFKFGTLDKYIKANLSSFKVLIEPNIEYCEDLLGSLQSIKKRFATRTRYYGDKNAEEALALISKELGVTLPENTDLKTLQGNIGTLMDAAEERLNLLLSIDRIFKRVNKSQKTNLDIENLEFDRHVMGRDLVLKDPEHVKIIKQFYLAVAKDPYILKGDPNAQLRIKTPKLIMAEIKSRVEANPTAYPELLSILKPFRLTPKEQITQIVEDKYISKEGEIHGEYGDVYNVLTDTKTTHEERTAAVNNSPLTDEEKGRIDDLLEK